MPVLNVYDNVALPVNFDRGKHMDHDFIEKLLKDLGIWDESKYIEKEFTISAVVSRPIAKNDYFIGDSGVSQVDIIMSGRQMQENFHVNGYNNISISLLENADHNNIIQQIHSAVADLNRCMIKDNTELIARKNAELNQKTYFFYGIAVILLDMCFRCV